MGTSEIKKKILSNYEYFVKTSKEKDLGYNDTTDKLYKGAIMGIKITWENIGGDLKELKKIDKKYEQ